MALCGFCCAMAGVAFFYGSTFFCLLLMSYAAFFSPSAGFYHFIEADKMVILDFLSKSLSVPLLACTRVRVSTTTTI